MLELVCITCKYLHSGVIYRGPPISYELAKSWIDHLNEKYGENSWIRRKHWLIEEDHGLILEHWITSVRVADTGSTA